MRLILNKDGTINVGYYRLLFSEQLIKTIKTTLDKIENRVKKNDLNKTYQNNLLGKDYTPLNSPKTKKEFFIGQVFKGYMEIVNTLELIDVTPYMIRQFPRNIRDIGKQQYFR